MPEPGVIVVNSSGNPCVIPVSVLRANAGPWLRAGWRVTGGDASVLDEARSFGFVIETAGERGNERNVPPFGSPQKTPRSSAYLLRPRPVIAHVSPWGLTCGGAQRHVATLVHRQSPWADVHVIAPRDDRCGDWVAELHPAIVHELPSNNDAAAVLRAIDPDVVHCHGPENKSLVEAITAGGWPVVGTYHRDWSGCAVTLPPWVVRDVRHGVDLAAFSPKRGPRFKRPFTVGIVGRLSSEKLPQEFLRALAAWKNDGAIVRIIGVGWNQSYAATCREIAASAPWIEFIGDVAPGGMPEIYRGLDAVLIPSVMESVSFVAIEAMACGVPVIARAIEGLPDTLGDAGLLVSTDAELIGAIEDVRGRDELRNRMIRRGRARAERLFDADRMANGFAAAYARVAPVVSATDNRIDASVVIPAWNPDPEWLKRAVASVVKQDGDHVVEVIVIDDGSDDPAVFADVESFGARVIHRAVRGGVGAALNDGIRAAVSPLILRLDADDYALPNRVAAQVEFMRAHPNIAVVGGQLEYDVGRSALAYDPAKKIWDQPWCLAHPATCIRRCVALRIGGYPEWAHGPEDLDLWCRIDAAGLGIAVTDDVVTHYRTHDGQESRRPETNTIADEIRNRYRAAS